MLEDNSAAGRKRVADSLNALHRYSLATVDDNLISVHRLLQKVIRDRLTGTDQASAITHALTAIQRAIPDDQHLPATWPQWQQLTPHVVALASIEVVASLSAAQLVKILNLTWEFLLAAGSNPPALDLATQAVSVSTARLGPEHRDTLTARGNLAESYRSGGGAPARPSPSWSRLSPTRAAARPRPPGHPFRPRPPRLLVPVGRRDGRGDRHRRAACPRHRAAARPRPPQHADQPGQPRRLAAGRRAPGEAIAVRAEQASPTRERLLGPDHPDTLTAATTSPTRYKRPGGPPRRSPLFEQTLADRERLLGPDHPDTLTSRNNLADALQDAGRLAEALAAVRADPRRPRAAARPRPPGHPDQPRQPRRRAAGGRAAAEALPLFEQTLADRERLLGPDHPDTLTSRNDLAVALQAAGRIAEALAAVRADPPRLRAAARPRPPGHPDRRDNLADALQAAGRHRRGAAAVRADARRPRAAARPRPPGHADQPQQPRRRAAGGRAAPARRCRCDERTLADRERLLGPDHPDTLTSRSNLAVALQGAGRPAEALPL